MRRNDLFRLPLLIIRTGPGGFGYLGDLPSCFRRIARGQKWYSRAISKITSSPRRLQVDRVNQWWKCFCTFFVEMIPGIVKGVKLDFETQKGIFCLFKFFIQSFAYSGEVFLLKRLKCICDFARFHSCNATNEPPEIEPNCLGSSRSSPWLRFPFLTGVLAKVRLIEDDDTPETIKELSYYWFLLSSVRKSFGPPSSEMESLSLLKHQKLLTSPVEVCDELVSQARIYGSRWATDNYTEVKSLSTSVSSSASIGYPRHEGGRATWFYGKIELLNAARLPVPPCDLYDFNKEKKFSVDWFNSVDRVEMDSPDKGFTFSPWFFYQGEDGKLVHQPHKLMRDCSLTSLCNLGYIAYTWDSPPDYGTDWVSWGWYTPVDVKFTYTGVPVPAVALPVADRGSKARIITERQPAVTTAMHFLKDWFYKLLVRDQHTILFERSGSIWNHLYRLKGWFKNCDVDNDVILSLDLSNATDTFHQKLCNAIAQGVTSVCPVWNELLTAICDMEFSPDEVYYPEIDFKALSKENRLKFVDFLQVVISKRGELMGDPGSWTILNLYLKLALKVSWNLFKRGYQPIAFSQKKLAAVLREMSSLEPLPYNLAYLTCGDDFLGILHRTLAAWFETVLELTGAIISPGVSSTSKNLGVFTETIWYFDWSTRDIISYEFLKPVTLAPIGIGSRLPGARLLPEAWSKGSTVVKYQSWCRDSTVNKTVFPFHFPDFHRDTTLFLHWVYRDFVSQCFRLGIPVYLPRQFGGLGFPSLAPWRHILPSHRRMVQCLLAEDLNPNHAFEGWKLSSIWQVAETPLGFEQITFTLNISMSILFDYEEGVGYVRKGLDKDWTNIHDACKELGHKLTYLSKMEKDLTVIFLRQQGFITLKEGLDAIVASRSHWILMGSTANDARSRKATKPSIYRVSKAFKEICKTINAETPRSHEFSPFRFDILQERLSWLDGFVWIKKAYIDAICVEN